MNYLNDFDYTNINFDDFYLYPSNVRKKIINDCLLLERLVKNNLKEDRYKHSLEVAKLARKLAIKHHVDPNKAYIAGILHDVTKEFDEEFHDSYLRYYDKDKLNYPKECKHSFSAKYYLKEKLNFHDKDILNAIYNHTICNSRDKLSMILYIADKREETRNINDDIVDIAYTNLYEGFYKLRKDVERYIEEVKHERFIKNSL